MHFKTLQPFRWGAFFLLISAVLHLVVWVFSGFSPEFTNLLPVATAYAALSIALMSLRWRLLAYVAFFVSALGGSLAMSSALNPSAVASWWFLAIVASNWLCAAYLFVGLWRSPISNGNNLQAN